MKQKQHKFLHDLMVQDVCTLPMDNPAEHGGGGDFFNG